MAAAEKTTVLKVVETTVEEEIVTLTLSKSEAAMLTALSGYVPHDSDANRVLYDLLKEAGYQYGLNSWADAEKFLGLKGQDSTHIALVPAKGKWGVV